MRCSWPADRELGRKLSVAGALLGWWLVISPASAHTHLQIDYTGSRWHLYLYDFASGAYEASSVPILVSAAARSTVPDSPAYTEILGPAGGPVWILPQAENPHLVYLGFSAEGIGRGIFAGNLVRVTLKRLDGPGHFALYTASAFGAPQVLMNSRDGLDDRDAVVLAVAAGGHLHANWAFSAAGTYRLGFEASGNLSAGGQQIASGPVEYTFIVMAPNYTLSIAPRSSADPTVTLTGPSAQKCEIEMSSDLANWKPFRTMTNFQSSATVLDAEFRLSPVRFYRARIQP